MIFAKCFMDLGAFNRSVGKKIQNRHILHPYPDSKVHGANMGPIWGRQNQGGPRVGPMNFVIWAVTPIPVPN